MKLFIFLFLFTSIFSDPWGKGADLKYQQKDPLSKKTSLLSKVANKIILFHQKNFSPIDGPRSHFRPTSSRYTQLAIQRYGFFKGFIMGCDRLLRENNEKWVYRTIIINNVKYKYDPAIQDKYLK